MPGLDPNIAQYTESRIPFRCGTCRFFVREGHPCQVVNHPISETGCCNFWTAGKQLYSGSPITPEAAGYIEVPGIDNYACGSCRYIDKNKYCSVIDRFVNDKFGSCNLWENDKEAMTKGVKNTRTGRQIVSKLEIADTLEKQIKGLLGRSTFSKGQGLLIPFSNQIHTRGMNFAIDVLFLSQDNIVVHTIQKMDEGFVSPRIIKASKVLELPSGTIRNNNIAQGDQLEIT